MQASSTGNDRSELMPLEVVVIGCRSVIEQLKEFWSTGVHISIDDEKVFLGGKRVATILSLEKVEDYHAMCEFFDIFSLMGLCRKLSDSRFVEKALKKA